MPLCEKGQEVHQEYHRRVPNRPHNLVKSQSLLQVYVVLLRSSVPWLIAVSGQACVNFFLFACRKTSFSELFWYPSSILWLMFILWLTFSLCADMSFTAGRCLTELINPVEQETLHSCFPRPLLPCIHVYNVIYICLSVPVFVIFEISGTGGRRYADCTNVESFTWQIATTAS